MEEFNDYFSLLINNGWNVKISTFNGGAVKGTVKKNNIIHYTYGLNVDDICKLLWFKTIYKGE